MKKHYFSQKRLLFWCQGIHLSFLEGLSGFEPLSLRLSGVRSNQLSYKPLLPLRRNVILPFRLIVRFAFDNWRAEFFTKPPTYDQNITMSKTQVSSKKSLQKVKQAPTKVETIGSKNTHQHPDQ